MNFPITVKDIIDILLVALILYETFRVLRKSGAVNLFWGILTFIIVWFLVSNIFHLELTGALFDQIISVGMIALIVIFQNEIRSFFYKIGSRFSNGSLRHFRSMEDEQIRHTVLSVTHACKHMSASKTGALIILTRQQDLGEYTDTGEKLDAMVSTRMIENIFFKNTPLHDGAMVVRNNRIHSAACILPVTRRTDLPKHYGLRHRAAMGLTERTDAVAVVVSEETGTISFAKGDDIYPVEPEVLAEELSATMGLSDNKIRN